MSYIYIIQLPEHRKTNEAVYKIGKTEQDVNKRFGGYPKGTIVFLVINVDNCHTAEKELLSLFSEHFTLKLEYGSEYFAGDVIQMIHMVYSYFLSHPPPCDNLEYLAKTEELKKTAEESKKHEEERKRLEDERKQQEELQKRLEEERKQQEFARELANFNNVKQQLYNAFQSLRYFDQLVPNLYNEIDGNNFKYICKQLQKYRKTWIPNFGGSTLNHMLGHVINMLNTTLMVYNRLYNKKEPSVELLSEFEILRQSYFGYGAEFASENNYKKVKTAEDCRTLAHKLSNERMHARLLASTKMLK